MKKKITFAVDETTYNLLKQVAKEQYLTVSSYIRKYIENQLLNDMGGKNQ